MHEPTERDAFAGLVDTHIHPSYSVDADPGATISAYAQRALDLGLTEICFTPHYDLNPARRDLDGWMMVDGELVPSAGPGLARYVAEVLAVRPIFEPQGLWVGLGLEVDYFPGVADLVAESLAATPFDLVIGSVHCLDRWALSAAAEAPACFAGRSLPDMARRYFDLVAEAAATGLFDVIGHLDIYKLYGRDAYGDAVFAIHRGLAEPALRSLVHHGVGLELNTASWRKGCTEPYPGAELLRLAWSMGVRTLSLGSDAHCLDDLGRDVGAARAIAARAGFETACTFRRRRAVPTVSLGVA